MCSQRVPEFAVSHLLLSRARSLEELLHTQFLLKCSLISKSPLNTLHILNINLLLIPAPIAFIIAYITKNTKTISRYLLSFLIFHESNSPKKGFLHKKLTHLKRQWELLGLHTTLVVHRKEHMN